MSAITPPNESQRLAALKECWVLDTDPEEVYDDITRLAAHIFGVPIAAISLVDADRQFFKSIVGLDVRETTRDDSFCAHTILNPEVMVIPDATQDSRFCENPFVIDEPHIRFYAGAPMITSDGFAIGSLCLIDRVPRTISDDQKHALQLLARQAGSMIDSSRNMIHNLQAVSERERAQEVLQLELDRLSRLTELKHDLYEAGADLDVSLALITESVNELTGADGALIEFSENDELCCKASTGIVRTLTGTTQVTPAINSASMQSKIPQYSNDCQTDTRVNQNVCDLFSIRSQYVIPIRDESTVVGTFTLCSVHADGFTKASKDTAQMIAGLISTAINRVSALQARKALAQLQEEINHERYITLLTLQETLTLHKAVLDGAVHAIIACDADGLVTLFNRAAEEMLGYSADEVVGKANPSIFHDPNEILERMEQFKRRYGRTIDSGFELLMESKDNGLIPDLEWTLVRKDGTTFQASLTVTSLKNPKGEITGYLGIGTDLTARNSARDENRLISERLQQAQRVAKIGSWEFDIKSGKVTWSDELFALTKRLVSQGPPTYEANLRLFKQEDAIALDRAVQRAVHYGEDYELELRLAEDDERVEWRYAIGKAIKGVDGKVCRLVGTLQDINAQKEAELKISHFTERLQYQKTELERVNLELEGLALTDSVTGLRNRHKFDDSLASECARSERYHSPLSLIMLDIDQFKLLNDVYGHQEGDRALRQVSEIIKKAIRKTDIACRFAGDELAIILPETDSTGALQLAERIRVEIQAQSGMNQQITVSVGVSTFGLKIHTADMMISAADNAMYRAKEAGRNRIHSAHGNDMIDLFTD